MATLIEQFAQTLRESHDPPLALENHTDEMLVTLATTSGRQQTVLVTLRPLPGSDQHSLQFVSRACWAKDHRRVREALLANAGDALCNLALDTSVNPQVINVVYSLVAEATTLSECEAILRTVAFHADALEMQHEGVDRF